MHVEIKSATLHHLATAFVHVILDKFTLAVYATNLHFYTPDSASSISSEIECRLAI